MNIKTRNGNVLCVREEKETDVSGIIVSEGAQVKSSYAVISDIEENDFGLKVGDRIHLPYQESQISEYSKDGIEYVIVKSKNLFAKWVGEKWTPINRFVKVKKCKNSHIKDESGEVQIYLGDKSIEKTNWVRIYMVAKDCINITKNFLGFYTESPEIDDGLQPLGRTKEYMLHEDLIEFVTGGE